MYVFGIERQVMCIYIYIFIYLWIYRTSLHKNWAEEKRKVCSSSSSRIKSVYILQYVRTNVISTVASINNRWMKQSYLVWTQLLISWTSIIPVITWWMSIRRLLLMKWTPRGMSIALPLSFHNHETTNYWIRCRTMTIHRRLLLWHHHWSSPRLPELQLLPVLQHKVVKVPVVQMMRWQLSYLHLNL